MLFRYLHWRSSISARVSALTLSILSATVTALAPDSPGQVMVALDAGACPLLARVTSRSAHLLGLAPGLALYAQIKGVAILG